MAHFWPKRPWLPSLRSLLAGHPKSLPVPADLLFWALWGANCNFKVLAQEVIIMVIMMMMMMMMMMMTNMNRFIRINIYVIIIVYDIILMHPSPHKQA